MKCLSIRQPWAWLIASGFKDIENRSWPTNFRGEFLIHAGKMPDEEMHWGSNRRQIEKLINQPMPDMADFQRGGIIGIAEIYDCVKICASPWFTGDYGFVIRNARPLSFLPMNGRLGFFDASHPDVQEKKASHDAKEFFKSTRKG
jgi:hypothetical protein